MKFFNLQYKNNLKKISKISNRNLYYKYYRLIKKIKIRNVDSSLNITKKFVNNISINKQKKNNSKMYQKDYYIKKKKYKKQLRYKLSNNEIKNRKLYTYHMTKDTKNNIKQKKKKSLNLIWDFCNPCEK